MQNTNKICRVCGREYEPCRSAQRGDGVFRWKEVACSPECGAIYLARINESRGIVAEQQEAQAPVEQPKAAEPTRKTRKSKAKGTSPDA